MIKHKEVLKYIVIFLLAFLVSQIMSRCFHPVQVKGDSMSPTLENGNIVIASSIFKMEDLRKGDIVVFIHDNKQLIKRIVGTPGDQLWVDDEVIYVNGEKSEFQYDSFHYPGMLEESIVVPDNEFFCVGDNCNNSYDCRAFGAITFSKIKYKVLRKLR